MFDRISQETGLCFVNVRVDVSSELVDETLNDTCGFLVFSRLGLSFDSTREGLAVDRFLSQTRLQKHPCRLTNGEERC